MTLCPPSDLWASQSRNKGQLIMSGGKKTLYQVYVSGHNWRVFAQPRLHGWPTCLYTGRWWCMGLGLCPKMHFSACPPTSSLPNAVAADICPPPVSLNTNQAAPATGTQITTAKKRSSTLIFPQSWSDSVLSVKRIYSAPVLQSCIPQLKKAEIPPVKTLNSKQQSEWLSTCQRALLVTFHV